MKIRYLVAALLLGLSLATPATARERTHKSVTRTQTHGIEGREIAAPPWSAACMTDHGPSECGEPMWIYRSSDASLSPETAHAQEYPWCACRGKAISIASTKHRSSVSGQHRASAVAP